MTQRLRFPSRFGNRAKAHSSIWPRRSWIPTCSMAPCSAMV
jgi:hypothetical protein